MKKLTFLMIIIFLYFNTIQSKACVEIKPTPVPSPTETPILTNQI